MKSLFMSSAISLLLLGLLSCAEIGRAADIEQEWNITYKTVYPDGIPKLVPVVNDQFPGPELRGRVGQTVRIRVNNHLPTDTTSIHWHGVKQLGTVWSDGVPHITQCPIGPGEYFVYEFTLTHTGTLWWHSHSGLQKSSLYGAIVITGDEDVVGKYEDRTLLFNDWYHEDTTSQVEGLLNPEFRWVGDPQTLLINGKGTFNCSSEEAVQKCLKCEPDHPDAGPFVLNVEPDMTYRLRLVGASSLAFVNFHIEKHAMIVVEADAELLLPRRVSHLDLGSGQTYSVLFNTMSRRQLAQTSKNKGLFWMKLIMRHRPAEVTALAYLNYSTSDETAKMPLRAVPGGPAWDDVQWSLAQARGFRSYKVAMLPNSSRLFTTLGTQNRLGTEEGRLVWSVNNYTYIDGKTPVLHAVKYELDETKQYVSQTTIPTTFNYTQSLTEAGLSIIAKGGTHVIKVEKDEVIDFVFQNTVALNAAPEIHPWHLHLHNFWILGYGDENATWHPSDAANYNLRRPVDRNTFNLYPNSWTAIRVKFDNPGVAHFHCHILPHLVMGMGFVVQIGDAADIPTPPAGTPFCGTISKLMGPPVRNPFVSGGCAA